MYCRYTCRGVRCETFTRPHPLSLKGKAAVTHTPAHYLSSLYTTLINSPYTAGHDTHFWADDRVTTHTDIHPDRQTSPKLATLGGPVRPVEGPQTQAHTDIHTDRQTDRQTDIHVGASRHLNKNIMYEQPFSITDKSIARPRVGDMGIICTCISNE